MRLPQKILPTILILKLINTLNRTSRIKVYRNYTKRTLIILKYKYLKTLIGLHLKYLNNYFNVIEYGSLIRVSQYYKYYTMLLIRMTV